MEAMVEEEQFIEEDYRNGMMQGFEESLKTGYFKGLFDLLKVCLKNLKNEELLNNLEKSTNLDELVQIRESMKLNLKG